MKKQIAKIISSVNLQKFESDLNDLLIKYTFVDLKKLNDNVFLFIGEEK